MSIAHVARSESVGQAAPAITGFEQGPSKTTGTQEPNPDQIGPQIQSALGKPSERVRVR